jgi:hypothetical protein
MLQLGQKLEQARLSAKLNPTAAAKKLQIPRSTYQYWEKEGPPLNEIPGIIKAFSLPDNYFFVNDAELLRKKVLPLGDLEITLQDHFNLLQKFNDKVDSYAATMQRIIEAKLLEPTNLPATTSAPEKTQEEMDLDAAKGMVGTSPIVLKAGGNYEAGKKGAKKK